MTAELKSTSQGRTMVLTLSNPEHRNALGPEMYAAGVEALSVRREPAPRCAASSSPAKARCSARAATCSGCRPTASAEPAVQAAEHRGRCTAGSRRSAPSPSRSSRRSKARRPAPAFRWRWPATSSSRRDDAVFAWPTATSRCRPTAALSWAPRAGAAAPAGQRAAACAASASARERLHALGVVNRVTPRAGRRWPRRWRWPSSSMPARPTRWPASRNSQRSARRQPGSAAGAASATTS